MSTDLVTYATVLLVCLGSPALVVDHYACTCAVGSSTVSARMRYLAQVSGSGGCVRFNCGCGCGGDSDDVLPPDDHAAEAHAELLD